MLDFVFELCRILMDGAGFCMLNCEDLCRNLYLDIEIFNSNIKKKIIINHGRFWGKPSMISSRWFSIKPSVFMDGLIKTVQK
jgi:hypothetical protein